MRDTAEIKAIPVNLKTAMGVMYLTKKHYCWRKPMSDTEQYCPICQRVIVASNIEEVTDNEHDGYIFIHDELPHGDDDIEALSWGIN